MPSRPAPLRDPATLAHVLPFAVFLLLLTLPDLLRVDNPELPWHRRAPEQWLYPLQTLACGALLLAGRRHYGLAPWRGLGGAVVLGVLGFCLWILPVELFRRLQPIEPPAWWAWFGLTPRSEGFNPADAPAGWQDIAVIARLLRLIVIVPLVEEIFWRGFLMRHLNAHDHSWREVPFGRHSWPAYGIVTTLVVVCHQPADWAAALVWASLVYALAVRTRSLGACVLMHATANTLLGVYVLRTGQWGLW